MLYKQPALAKLWNYNILVQILYSYFRCTDRLFLGCPHFVAAVTLSGFHEKPRRNEDWITKKVHRRICLRDITFLVACPPFYVTFLLLSLSTPSPFQSDVLAEWSL